jgi:hypothetical protein
MPVRYAPCSTDRVYCVYEMRCWTSLVLAPDPDRMLSKSRVQDRLFAQVLEELYRTYSTDRALDLHDMNEERRSFQDTHDARQKQPYRLLSERSYQMDKSSTVDTTVLQGSENEDDCSGHVVVRINNGHKWLHHRSDIWTVLRQFLGHQSFPPDSECMGKLTVYCL